MKKIYINLPVKDLDRTKDFFAALGFDFEPRFTNENAASVILGENMYAMLLKEDFFIGFIPGRSIAKKESTEVLVALSADSRDEVDALIDKAVRAGGTEYRETTDQDGMYGRAFEDPDGHIWEIGYMEKD